MRVRLKVQPGDFGDIEFDTFTGMIAVLDGMTKSLHNTEWLSTPLTGAEMTEAVNAVENLRAIFERHREDRVVTGEIVIDEGTPIEVKYEL